MTIKRVLGRCAFATILTLTLCAQGQADELKTDLTPSGVGVYEGAMIPVMRRWQYPQSLYQQYRWTGQEYSNYARERYERYVNIELEGFRHYDMYGNFIARGFEIYDWSMSNPAAFGSELRKSQEFSRWFNNLVVSSMSNTPCLNTGTPTRR